MAKRRDTPPPAEEVQDPNADARYTARETSRRAIESKWYGEGPDCPVCKNDTWQIGDLADLPVRNPGSDIGTVAAAEHVYPVIPSMCTYCGYMLFHNGKFLFAESERTEASKKKFPDPPGK